MDWQCGSPCKDENLKGGGYSLTLVQRIYLNQERERAINCGQRRLIFELSCYKGKIPAILQDTPSVQDTPREACCGNKFAALNYNGNIRYKAI